MAPWGLCQSAAPSLPKVTALQQELCYLQQRKSSCRLEPAHTPSANVRKAVAKLWPASSWIGAEGHRAFSYQPPKATTARRSHCRALHACSAILDLTCSLQGVISLCQESPELKGLKDRRPGDMALVTGIYKLNHWGG